MLLSFPVYCSRMLHYYNCKSSTLSYIYAMYLLQPDSKVRTYIFWIFLTGLNTFFARGKMSQHHQHHHHPTMRLLLLLLLHLPEILGDLKRDTCSEPRRHHLQDWFPEAISSELDLFYLIFLFAHTCLYTPPIEAL